MINSNIYQDIAARTGGAVMLGVVGPVRTGKSTFIKRFMDTLVIPNIDNVYVRERAKDELPQSGSGRTIMTSEPKFVPEEAAQIRLPDGTEVSVRLVDCVGYMVPGASGQFEDGQERLVTTPWFDHEITMTEAAEQGTRKVIAEHSTIGLVVTTDGSICEIPREDYVAAEERVISELQAIGKPFIVLLNCSKPNSDAAKALAAELSEKYGVTVMRVNCLELDENGITEIISSVLGEFPITELDITLPEWVDALPMDNELKSGLFSAIAEACSDMNCVKDVQSIITSIAQDEKVSGTAVTASDMGTGIISVAVSLPRSLYYQTISAQSGFDIESDGDLMSLLTEMRDVKTDYDRIKGALDSVRQTGYGVVMPQSGEMELEEPQIVRRGGKYTVRLKARAPAIHMLRTNVETEVTPALGGATASEEIMGFLLQGFEGDVSKIWQSNIFGKSLYDIAGEGLTAKINALPENARSKLQETLQKVINEGSGGLICIIL
jgi:stage IV sporulation protein A